MFLFNISFQMYCWLLKFGRVQYCNIGVQFEVCQCGFCLLNVKSTWESERIDTSSVLANPYLLFFFLVYDTTKRSLEQDLSQNFLINKLTPHNLVDWICMASYNTVRGNYCNFFLVKITWFDEFSMLLWAPQTPNYMEALLIV